MNTYNYKNSKRSSDSFQTEFFDKAKYPALHRYLDQPVVLQPFFFLLKENVEQLQGELSTFLIDISHITEDRQNSDFRQRASLILDRLFEIPSLREFLLNQVETPENISCYIARNSLFIFEKFLPFYFEQGKITSDIWDKSIKLMCRDNAMTQEILHKLCRKANPNIALIQKFLEKGANPDIKDDRSNTCLHTSCMVNKPNKELVELLLEHTKAPYDTNLDNLTAFDYVCNSDTPNLDLAATFPHHSSWRQTIRKNAEKLLLCYLENESNFSPVNTLSSLREYNSRQNFISIVLAYSDDALMIEKLQKQFDNEVFNTLIKLSPYETIFEPEERLSPQKRTELKTKILSIEIIRVLELIMLKDDDGQEPFESPVEQQAVAGQDWDFSFFLDALSSFSLESETKLYLQMISLLVAVTLFAAGFAVAGLVTLAVTAGIGFFMPSSSDEPNSPIQYESTREYHPGI